MDAAYVVGKLVDLFRREELDLSAMRALFHPDARLRTIVGGPQVLTAGEAITSLEQARRDGWFAVTLEAPVALDEHAATLRGRVRRSVPGGGFADDGHSWTLTVRDGLIYRQCVYAFAGEAAAAYQQLGVCLGIVDAPDVPDSAADTAQPKSLKRWKPAPGDV